MAKHICAQCGKEKDYEDFPIPAALILVPGVSICSICTVEKVENLTLIDKTTPKMKRGGGLDILKRF